MNRKTNIARASADRVRCFKYLYRNDVHFYRQFGIQGWTYLIIKNIIAIINILIFSEDRKKKLNVLTNGFKDGLSFTPEIEYLNKR